MRLISIISLVLLSFQSASAAPAPIPADALVITESSNLIVYKDSIGADGKHQELMRQLEQAPANPVLYLDSPGGSIIQGMDVIEVIQRRGDVTCVSPKAASMAMAIMQSCKVRIASGKMPIFMAHPPQIVLQGQKSLSELEDVIEQFLKPMEKILVKLQATRMGMTEEAFRLKTRYDWFIVGPEAILKNKAADEHRLVVCTPGAVAKQVETVKVTQGFFGAKVEKIKRSFCPLIQDPPSSDGEK